MKKIITLSVLFCLAFTMHAKAQNKTSEKLFEENYTNSKRIINSKNYQFTGTIVYKNKKREKITPENNTLNIKASKIEGKVQSIGSENKTFEFNDTIQDYSVTFNDETQKIEITFKTNNYQNVSISIKPNGYAFLTVTLSNNNYITQTGRISKG